MLSTVQVLREVFNADTAYIAKFKLIAKKANITLDKFLLGKVDSKIEYTSEERAEIVTTLKILVAQQFSKVKPSEKRTYTASAGAPGTGKTFALEHMFNIDVANEKFPENAVYIGPDSVVLAQMPAHLRDCANSEIGCAKAYAKWRDASNYIANFMLVKAMVDGVDIVHDTTATSPKIKTILDTLGKLNYTRNMHLYIADKDARERAIMHRKEQIGYTMVTLADATSKAAAVYERLTDRSFADRVEQMIVYAQQGQFWLGMGNTVAFIIYNPAENPDAQILAGGQQYVEHVVQQVNEKENLKPELLAAFNELVETLVKAPEIKETALSTSRLVPIL